MRKEGESERECTGSGMPSHKCCLSYLFTAYTNTHTHVPHHVLCDCVAALNACFGVSFVGYVNKNGWASNVFTRCGMYCLAVVVGLKNVNTCVAHILHAHRIVCCRRHRANTAATDADAAAVGIRNNLSHMRYVWSTHALHNKTEPLQRTRQQHQQQ